MGKRISIPPLLQDGTPAAWQGVNLLLDPRRIQDVELVLSQNAVTTKPGVLSKRQGIAYDSTTGLVNSDQNSGHGVPILSTIVPFNSGAVALFATRGVAGGLPTTTQFHIRNQNPVATFSTNIVTKRKPGVAFALQKAYQVFGPPYSAHFLAISSLGAGTPTTATDELAAASATGAGATATRFNPPSNYGLDSPAVVANYGDRMVYGNFGAGFESVILISDAPSRSTITPSADALITVAAPTAGVLSRSLVIGGARDGDRIVAMREVMLTQIGGLPQKALLILKEYSVFLLTGEPNQTTDNTTTNPPYGNLNISQVAYNCGCSSAETVVTTPYGTFWAGPDDVWMFSYGQSPVRVGSKIRPALLQTPSAFRYRWHAAYFNGFYRLAIDDQGFGIDDDAPCAEQWWLDLRHGPPQGNMDVQVQNNAQWWGPNRFVLNVSGSVATVLQTGTYNMFTDQRAGETPALYGFERGQITLNQPGPVKYPKTINMVTYDQPVMFDSASDGTAGVSAGTTDTEIKLDIRTKEFDLGDGMVDKIVDALELNTWVDRDAVVNLDFIMDGGAIVDTQQKQVAQLGFATDVDSLGSPVFRQTQAVKVFANPNSRDIGKTFQLRLYDTPGYYVVAGANDTFVVQVNTGGGGPTVVYSATIAAGYYATVSALATAIAAALSAAFLAVTFAGSVTANAVTLAVSGIGSPTFNPCWVSGDYVGAELVIGGVLTGQAAVASSFSAAQLRSTKKIAALLGFNTGSSGAVLTAASISGAAVYATVIPLEEFARMTMQVGVLPRRPV